MIKSIISKKEYVKQDFGASGCWVQECLNVVVTWAFSSASLNKFHILKKPS